MTKYRNALPQTRGEVLLTDSGLETTLVFHDGLDLPEFASFPLLDDPAGAERLRQYYVQHVQIAKEHGRGIVLETPTWRASSDWAPLLGYDDASLADVVRRSVEQLNSIRDEHETDATSIVVSGNLGPRGDGYDPGAKMTAAEAEAYHQPQIDTLVAAGVDMVSVLTVNYVEEAIGVARAAANVGIEAAICFTVETDGNLPTGQTLRSAIEEVDAATDASPVYYGINCAHPSHFDHVLVSGASWVERIGMLRANASAMSHEELDNAEELDAGDPVELGAQYGELRTLYPSIRVIGGCCGTDHRHVAEIARSCFAPSRV